MFKDGRYIGPWLQVNDPPGGSGDPPKPDPDPKPDPEPPKPADPLDGLTPEQRKAVNAIAAAARREGETTGRTAAETAAAAKLTADKVKREQDDEVARRLGQRGPEPAGNDGVLGDGVDPPMDELLKMTRQQRDQVERIVAKDIATQIIKRHPTTESARTLSFPGS